MISRDPDEARLDGEPDRPNGISIVRMTVRGSGRSHAATPGCTGRGHYDAASASGPTLCHGRIDLKAAIRTIPDYPKPGIMFRDITTLLG